MRSSRGAAAVTCCSWSRASSRCVVVVTPPLLRRPRERVISSAVAPPFSNASSSFPAADASRFVIRAPKTESEFYAIAALRAEAYYADQPGGGGRFVESYKKQFREQEARSLRERVAPRRRKKEGVLNLKGGAGRSGGGGVFGGVLGVLVGRATSGASSDSAAADSSAEGAADKDSSADLFLPPECECLAAVEVAAEEEEEEAEEEGEGEAGGGGGRGSGRADGGGRLTRSPPPSSPSVVLGALDLRPPFSAGGGHPAGVPLSDATGCAVLNVAVHPSSRRRGVARELLRSAREVATARWGATALYTTVAATNAGARALYADFGFVEAASAVGGEEEQGSGGGGRGGVSPPTTLVGRELLLRVEL